MGDFTDLFMLIGCIVGLFLLVGGAIYLIGKHKQKKKATTSLPNGSDNTEFTENFIRKYDNQ